MRGIEWWDRVLFPIKRVWIGIATRLGVRRSGLGKLRKEVRTCEYEDVQVMWEMLRKGGPAIVGGGGSRQRRRRGRRRRRAEHVWADRRAALCNFSRSL